MMGVKGLWEALEPIKTEVAVSELKGQRLAVDLSGWICECKLVPNLQPVQALRSIFFRATHLMSMGVRLVIVLDGTPPLIKQQALEKRQAARSNAAPAKSRELPSLGSQSPFRGSQSPSRGSHSPSRGSHSPSRGSHSPSRGSYSPSRGRQSFNNSQLVTQARRLLESLGLPWLQATGEGEALCASLSQNKQVDGCLTQDGDALLYGARRVYRNFSLNKQSGPLDCYDMVDVEEKLGLVRNDLIAMALLTGCDYDSGGVKFIGVDKATNLIKELKNKHTDVLERVCSWRDCRDLDKLKSAKDNTVRGAHCSKCSHLGTKPIHMSSGCKLCSTEKDCTDKNHLGNKPHPCRCDWHKLDGQMKESKLEINIREKALENEEFPNLDVVQEFKSTESVTEFCWRKPRLETIMMAGGDILQWSDPMMVSKVLPVLVWCDMKARTDTGYFQQPQDTKRLLQPKKIVKSRRKDFIDCYDVTWERLESDKWSDTDLIEYTSAVEQQAFSKAFPDLVEQFQVEQENQKALKAMERKAERAKKSKRKAGSVDSGKGNKKIKDFFAVKKANLHPESKDVTSPSQSSAGSTSPESASSSM